MTRTNRPAPVPGDDLVVRTRFVPPTMRRHIIARPRVDAIVARALEYPLTVVQAEPGYGKTRAVASWLATTDLVQVRYNVGETEWIGKKDLIISGGVNMYPKGIEEVIVTHPDVLAAAVFSIPNESGGEAPMRAVVLKEGASIDSSELKSLVKPACWCALPAAL